MKDVIRAIGKIRKAISMLNLDLTGYKVLTEVGSNEYLYTPIIAALSGAEEVYAYTKDTRYGKASDIIKECSEIVEFLGIRNCISFNSGEISKIHLGEADIITNSGFLRPLDENKLKFAKDSVVIPLMYEKWELRESDVDPDYCKKRGLKLGGTWENHPDLMVFEHVGPLAIKMALNASYEVYRNNIIVWSDDHFGEVIEKAFRNFGANKVTLTNDRKVLRDNIQEVDFIFVCDYSELRDYSSNEVFNLDGLLLQNENLGLVHLYGELNYEKLAKKMNIVYPEFDGRKSIMTHTLSHVGLNPIINLQVAGFKVGQLMLTGENSNLIQYF